MNDEAIHIPARKKQQTGAQMAVKVTPEAYNASVTWKKMIFLHHHAVQDIIWQRKEDSQLIVLMYMKIF